MKFRKKPIVINAVQWDGSADTANTFIGDGYGTDWRYESAESQRIFLPLLEGDRIDVQGWWCAVDIGDWIIKGAKGEFYPCKPDIFAATYESAEPQPRPTIQELEAILNSDEDIPITINSDGSISA